MAVVNYSGILASLKTAISNDSGLSFRYKPANLWFNMELGIFPTSQLQNAFTIRFNEQGGSSYEMDTLTELGVELEFGLNPLNDMYLNKLGDCSKAISNLEEVVHSDIDRIDTDTDFTTTYGDDIVVVTFDNINIQIRNTN